MVPQAVKIYLATSPTDMRKQHDGLSALVRQELAEDVYSGHLFVFVNRRGDRVKILTWDGGGYVLWYKRLERGRFRIPKILNGQRAVKLDPGQLAMLLDGVDYSRVPRQKRWNPPSNRAIQSPLQ
jgi:transposase